MIILTGAAGFIGSCMITELNNQGQNDIILVDDFSRQEKTINYTGKKFREQVDRQQFFEWISKHTKEIDFVLHIGARTDTTEFNMAILDELNLNYSKSVWKFCTEHHIPLIYASSAATYGDGSQGYRDDHDLSFRLQPLNPYGISKNEFDKWALKQYSTPPCWYGLKFFNVYGPNEYHKGRMASVVFHSFEQISRPSGQGGKEASVRLFMSHNPKYKDGEQLRDFIYVKDVTDVIWFLMNHRKDSGIYNLGTGTARTFIDLVHAVFAALDRQPVIEFIPIPEDIREKYQYFTEAQIEKLFRIGCHKNYISLEAGIGEYVREYLIRDRVL